MMFLCDVPEGCTQASNEFEKLILGNDYLIDELCECPITVAIV